MNKNKKSDKGAYSRVKGADISKHGHFSCNQPVSRSDLKKTDRVVEELPPAIPSSTKNNKKNSNSVFWNPVRIHRNWELVAKAVFEYEEELEVGYAPRKS